MRKAIVENATGKVVNVIELPPGWAAGNPSYWQPPAGHTVVDATLGGSPGDTWDGAQFVRDLAQALSEKEAAAREANRKSSVEGLRRQAADLAAKGDTTGALALRVQALEMEK